MRTGSFLGVKRQGLGLNHPSASSAEIRGRMQLCMSFPSGRSWQVTEQSLPFAYSDMTMLRFSAIFSMPVYEICLSGGFKSCVMFIGRNLLWFLLYSRLYILPPVRPSAWKNSTPTGRILIKLYVQANFFRKCVEKVHVSLKSNKNNGHFAWRSTYIYDNILLILRRIKGVSENIQHKIKKHIQGQ
jgi:hypothetical protein